VSSVATNARFLRVLFDYKETKQRWVGECLETGNVSTGSTFEEARDEMLTVLRFEVSFAREQNNFKALFRNVPAELVHRWEAAIRDSKPEEVPLFPEGGTEVELARAA
jgi:predicted RNase H-like HicB family nuclease